MWADTLLAAERQHLIRLAIWAVANAVVGVSVLAILSARRVAAPIAWWFAVQTSVWGSAALVIAGVRWQRAELRDVSGASRLEHLTWLLAGVDIGIVGIGATVAVLGWIVIRRLSLIGAGLGVLVQGLGLLVLDLTFASVLSRLM